MIIFVDGKDVLSRKEIGRWELRFERVCLKIDGIFLHFEAFKTVKHLSGSLNT